jgi:hypothetical protein
VCDARRVTPRLDADDADDANIARRAARARAANRERARERANDARARASAFCRLRARLSRTTSDETHHVPHVARQRDGRVLAIEHAGLVEVTDVNLHGRVILRLDEAVRPAALAGDVKVDVLTLGVLHFRRVFVSCACDARDKEVDRDGRAHGKHDFFFFSGRGRSS